MVSDSDRDKTDRPRIRHGTSARHRPSPIGIGDPIEGDEGGIRPKSLPWEFEGHHKVWD